MSNTSIQTPTNNSDYKAMYENLIAYLIKTSAPSHLLGYAAQLYNAISKKQD